MHQPYRGGLPCDGVGVYQRECFVCRLARLSERHFAAPAGGIFPVLLLAATRRKGDFVPGLVLRFLGSPVVLIGIYLFFLGAILVYGLFIYQDPIQRIITLVIGAAIVVVTFAMLRRGMLKKRTVVELHADYSPGGRHQFNATVGGKPA